jgi:hypothetical protein
MPKCDEKVAMLTVLNNLYEDINSFREEIETEIG